MEGEAISATIEVLVQNLINLSKEEISLIQGLDENAEMLRDTLDMVQSYLEDAQSKSITDAAVKTWLKKLEAAAFEADNVLDELNYQLLSDKIKKKVPSCFPSFNHCVHRRDVAVRINKVNASFEAINKRATELGLQEKLAAAPAASDATPETDSFTVDPIFIGRDDDVSKLVGMLTTPTEEAVSVLPIVGMGGLGKTTLARNVFNHQNIQTHFGKQIWVHVSQIFDAVLILKKILKNLQGGNVEDQSREDLLKKLQEALKANTYLLVLDDVWNEVPHKWDDFIRSWSGITPSKGNFIMVTTRKTGVGSLVKTHDMHVLNGLSEEECWSIVKKKAFEGGAITPNLEDIGRSIAKRCQGLPLAANVVGGVLRGKSQDEWRSIKENWLSDVGGNENYISRILELSFRHLPSQSLKKCFAYCSIFPKGSWINRRQLIELWMAEGFLQPSQTSDMETVGYQFLKVLMQNSLLQVVESDEYGEVKHCTMHDLVHDVAVSISDDVYYKGEQSSQIPKVQGKMLRTLIYNGRISDMVFSNFKSLHALTLMNYDVKKLPDSISELIHLRLLDVSNTSIRYLPNSIGKLSYLQTIRYLHPTWQGGLKKLPCTLKYLFNLRHLYLADRDTTLPPHLGRLAFLQTLPFFQVRNEEGSRIVELENLKNLKGELEIYNLERVQGEEESKKANLFPKLGIVRLELRWLGEGTKGKTNHVNVLKGLQPHPNIKVLHIVGFGGASFPTWTLRMAVFHEAHWVRLHNLTEIRLESCSECEEIPTLGHLPHLKSLYLSRVEKIKCIGASFYGIEESSSNDVFPALERLELLSMPNLTEWEEAKIQSGAQVKVFPCLGYLSIKGCHQLSCAPSQFTSLKELCIEEMDSELPLASICSIKLKTLTELKIDGIKELVSLPDWLFHNNQRLSTLEIEGCPKLVELPGGMGSLNSLEELSLIECGNLKSVSGGIIQGLTLLRTLKIEGCPKLVELPGGMGSLNSLEELRLIKCGNLKSVSGGIIQGLTSLRTLVIYECPLLISFLGEMEEPFAPVLKELGIDAGGSDGWDSVSINKAVDGILRFGIRSHSLRVLHLWGKEDWESLPDQIQHLTSLSQLLLSRFGMEELPEWIGNLSSLQELYLYGCKKLKHLPSVEAMRRLTKLTTLWIDDCPLLKERCKEPKSGDDVDSEWPKISHIPSVRFLD